MPLFDFLKYIQPTHYFRLFRKDGTSVFPVADQLPEAVKEVLSEDPSFESEAAKQYDLSWQAIQKGYIGPAETYRSFKKLPLTDEYYFVKKYFHPVWAWYILIIRLASLKNPVQEIRAFRKTGTEKLPLKPVVYKKWENFTSGLLERNPLVSVIIPTLNRYSCLEDVLKDLENQTYSNFEVLVVDQSDPFREDFYRDFSLDLRLVYQKEPALWKARNSAVSMANGDYILLFDDDSRIGETWIENHLKALDFFDAAVSSGISISQTGSEVPENYSYFHVSSQIDTGNVLIKKEVFETTGLFDRQFEGQRMGDGEFGLRVFQNNFLNISNPFASRFHLKAASGGLRQMGSWDGFRPGNILAPRPVPSVLYYFRTRFGRKRTIYALMKSVPPSVIPYRFKKNRKSLAAGVLISLLLFPVILLQVLVSWNLASKKIREGPRIDRFVRNKK